MKQGHLTEYQLQQYLDGQHPHDYDIESHLTGCHTCRETLESYRIVYGALSAAPEVRLNASVRSRVMAQIRPAGRFKISFETGFSIAFLLTAMITAGYLTGFSVDFGKINGFFAGLIEQLPKINVRIISDNIVFILVPLLIIIVIELLDKKVIKLKY